MSNKALAIDTSVIPFRGYTAQISYYGKDKLGNDKWWMCWGVPIGSTDSRVCSTRAVSRFLGCKFTSNEIDAVKAFKQQVRDHIEKRKKA